MKPPKHRSPVNRNGVFCWARIVHSDGATWRLYRRDQTGRVHALKVEAKSGDKPRDVARVINRARHQLRNEVDDIDFVLMGVTDGY
jgi:hypothetical protein